MACTCRTALLPTWRQQYGIPPDPAASHGLADVVPLAEEGGLSIAVAGYFPLTEIVAAARMLEQPHAPGKIVLNVT